VDVARLVSLQQGKHAPTYLLGRWSADGWPQHYLVAFAVKSTPGFLLACAAAALVASAVPPLVTTWAGRVAVIVIASLHAVPTILAARGGHVPYFNVLAGGEAGGHGFLLDSNLDWGQDLPRLKRWMQSHGVEKIQLAYFGRDDPSRYRMRHRDLPGAHICDEGPAQHLFRGVVVVSPNALFAARLADERYAQLARRPPDARAGVLFIHRLGDEGYAGR
jgi:hypothetical protein